MQSLTLEYFHLPPSFCLQLWNLKTTECANTFKPSLSGSQGDVTINSIHILPKSSDHFVICNRSNTVTLMNLQGQVSEGYIAESFCQTKIQLHNAMHYRNVCWNNFSPMLLHLYIFFAIINTGQNLWD